MSDTLRGLPAAPGRGWGLAFVPEEGSASRRPAGGQALAAAMAQVRRRLQAEQARCQPPESDIIFAHLQMLSDPLLADQALQLCEEGREPGAAWRQAAAGLEQMLEGLAHPALRARAADLRDVAGRVLAALERRRPRPLPRGAVVVAHELTPSLVLAGARRGAAAFAAETGSAACHACIILRSLGLPAVVGVPGLLQAAGPGRPVLVDGDRGRVVLDPPAGARATARQMQADGMPALTREGRVIPVVCNVANLQEVALAARLGADGIGVFRTEHLFYQRRRPPASRVQARLYRQAVELMGGKPVVIRALDAGSDKPVPYLAAPQERNPALGWRGLRSLLDRPRLLAAQVRAVLAAGPVSLLLPMVSSLQELRRARAIIERCQQQAGRRVGLGVMIEVPAAAWQAAALASECDFLSIGSNDLLQYFYAADRTNQRVAGCYSALEPAFLGLLARVAEAGARQGKPVHLCGELASDPRVAGLLIGLGIGELSVRPPQVAPVKAAVRQVGPEAKQLAEQALSCTDAAQVMRLL